jgi:hypothetical protein
MVSVMRRHAALLRWFFLSWALAISAVDPCQGSIEEAPSPPLLGAPSWRSLPRRLPSVGPLALGAAKADVPLSPFWVPGASTVAEPLEGLYEDPLQQAVPFGRRSFYLAPWRAYMDTWPARQFLDCLGINFNVSPTEAEATAQVLSAAGFCSARVELGWGAFSYEDPAQLTNPEPFRRTMKILQRAGLRPLVVLNANSQVPVPRRFLNVTLREAAPAGSRELHLAAGGDMREIRTGYTGLVGQDPEKIGFPLIVSFDPDTGKCELSASLPKALSAGPFTLALLRYHPFGGQTLADGTPNPFAQETLDGWRQYVAAACRIVQDCLGTRGAPDAGFDVEVWNELTFGSSFLDEKHYYSPERAFRDRLHYATHGRECFGPEVLLPITVDYVADPAHGLPGVKVISGFANQRPWECGESLWPKQAGFSRHFYTELNPRGPFRGYSGFLSPETDNYPSSGPLNALGGVDGTPDHKDWYTVRPGTFFVPQVEVSMPEAFHYSYKQEFITRDLQPFPCLWKGHYRYSHAGDGRAAEVWMTETNTFRWPWIKQLLQQTGAGLHDSRVSALCDWTAAKALLRGMVFQSHKGVHRIELYAAKAGDAAFGVIPDEFFEMLARHRGALTPEALALQGRSLQVLGRVTRLLRDSESLQVTRALRVESLGECEPRLVFAGDGTLEHPDRFNRDDFACLPFQLSANRYAIAYYVVTQNMVKSFWPDRELLDPERYAMPDQNFELTLRNVRGEGARISVYDPMTEETVPVHVLASGPDTLKVLISSVDYPRFLLVEESQPGPLILAPSLGRQPDGSAVLRFESNLPVRPTVTWGAFPGRIGVGQQTMPLGTTFELSINNLSPGEGIRIRVERGGLITEWPRWLYDTAGVLWPAFPPGTGDDR